jgi:hypothetical protein
MKINFDEYETGDYILYKMICPDDSNEIIAIGRITKEDNFVFIADIKHLTTTTCKKVNRWEVNTFPNFLFARRLPKKDFDDFSEKNYPEFFI